MPVEDVLLVEDVPLPDNRISSVNPVLLADEVEDDDVPPDGGGPGGGPPAPCGEGIREDILQLGGLSARQGAVADLIGNKAADLGADGARRRRLTIRRLTGRLTARLTAGQCGVDIGERGRQRALVAGTDRPRRYL